MRLPVATKALTGGGGLSEPMDVQHDIVYNNMDPFAPPSPLPPSRTLQTRAHPLVLTHHGACTWSRSLKTGTDE